MTSLPLTLLVCPESHQSLRYATEPELALLQKRFEEQALTFSSGDLVSSSFTHALIRQDGQRAYLIRNNIPTLLIAEAVMITGNTA